MKRKGVFDEPKIKRDREFYWISGDGKVWNISEMEDHHILNCLHLCERREGHKGATFLNHAPTYRALLLELVKRGKLTEDYFKLSVKDRLRVRI